VYLNNSPGPMQAMLSAIDEEMNRCLAELRMLGSNYVTFGSNAEDREPFKRTLNAVTEKLNELYKKIEGYMSLNRKSSIEELVYSISETNNEIKQLNFSSPDTTHGWGQMIEAANRLFLRVQAMEFLSRTSNDEIHDICAVIMTELQPIAFFSIGASDAANERRMLLRLKAIGTGLKEFSTLKEGYYGFLNNKDASGDTSAETLMLEIIDILSNCVE
jgi:hypothetical protein